MTKLQEQEQGHDTIVIRGETFFVACPPAQEAKYCPCPYDEVEEIAGEAVGCPDDVVGCAGEAGDSDEEVAGSAADCFPGEAGVFHDYAGEAGVFHGYAGEENFGGDEAGGDDFEEKEEEEEAGGDGSNSGGESWEVSVEELSPTANSFYPKLFLAGESDSDTSEQKSDDEKSDASNRLEAGVLQDFLDLKLSLNRTRHQNIRSRSPTNSQFSINSSSDSTNSREFFKNVSARHSRHSSRSSSRCASPALGYSACWENPQQRLSMVLSEAGESSSDSYFSNPYAYDPRPTTPIPMPQPPVQEDYFFTSFTGPTDRIQPHQQISPNYQQQLSFFQPHMVQSQVPGMTPPGLVMVPPAVQSMVPPPGLVPPAGAQPTVPTPRMQPQMVPTRMVPTQSVRIPQPPPTLATVVQKSNQSPQTTFLQPLQTARPVSPAIQRPVVSVAGESRPQLTVEIPSLCSFQKASKTNLYVCGFPTSWQVDDLERIFSKYGAIDKTRVLTDMNAGENRGVGFVHYREPEDAKTARNATHGTSPLEAPQPITVKFANMGGKPSPFSGGGKPPANPGLCKFWVKGECSRGESCFYLHEGPGGTSVRV